MPFLTPWRAGARAKSKPPGGGGQWEGGDVSRRFHSLRIWLVRVNEC